MIRVIVFLIPFKRREKLRKKGHRENIKCNGTCADLQRANQVFPKIVQSCDLQDACHVERESLREATYKLFISLTLAWLRDYRNYIEVRIFIKYVGPASPYVYCS